MVDRQHRPGAKTGSGGPASSQDANIEHRERLKKLALETIDIKKDPYFMTNHLGTYECRLCLTLHTNEGSYLAHTQGKKHQTNLSRRQNKERQEQNIQLQQNQTKGLQKKKTIKIGRPGYKIFKMIDPTSGQKQITFEIDYEQIEASWKPFYRIMSSYEQKVEQFDKIYQYVVFAAEPYDNIAFKIPNMEIDMEDGKFYQDWNKDKKKYTLHLTFKDRQNKQQRNQKN
ncbi:hypothetical protein ABPG72_020286 [Tetrahymena utriculariae]